MNPIPEAVQKQIDAAALAAAEKAVSDRMAALPSTPVTAPVAAPKLSVAKRAGLLLQKQFAEKFGADAGMGADERKSVIEKANALVGTSGQGGSMMPPEFASEVIGALHEQSVLSLAGAQRVPYSGTSITFGKLNTGVALGWTTEDGAPTAANISTGSLVLSNKYLKGYAEISNALLRAQGPDMAAVLGGDVIAAAAAEVDAKFLTGAGTGNLPTGILEQLHADQTEAITATPTAAKVRTDLANAMKRVRKQKLPFVGMSPAWIMDADTYFALLALRDGAGNAFPALEQSNTLFGHPVYVTEGVSDLCAFVLMRHVLIGENFGPQVGMGLQGTNLVAGVSTIYFHFVGDAKIRYDRAASVITGTSAWAAI